VTFAIGATAHTSEAAWVRIYDVTGRVVKSMTVGALTPGLTRLTWNGNDDHGRPVSSGTYLLQLEGAGGRHGSVKATIVR
jgi:flagellar hook assembly protein FlgD